MHDQEHKLGAVEILTKSLHSAVVSDTRSNEIERLLQLLAMVYRCSDSTCVDSICNQGSLLLPLLVTAAVTTSPSERCHQVTIAFFNRIRSLSIPLSMLKNSDLLLIAFVRLLKSFSATKRWYALVGLRSFTSSGNSKVIAMRFPGLIDAIIREQRDCEAEVAKTLASFSLALENKPAFVKTRGVLDTVMRMAKSTDECTVHDACTTIENLSSNYSLRTDLVQFQSGEFIKQLFTLLSKSKNDIKDKILQILSNLVGESTASLIAGSDYIIKFLSDIGSESYLAVKIIKRLSKHIDAKHPRHQALCEALVKLSSCDKRDVCLWTARAYVEQSLKMSTRFLIPRCEDLLNGLLLLSKSKYPRVRIPALEAVANLFEDGANTQRLSKNEKVLRVIVQSISGKNGGGNTGTGRRHAVRAALLIANHKVASRQAAKHDGLIQSLSKYGTSVDGDVELKQAALYGVLLLAPSM
mmetsp:Transcript_16259/g.24579  ORF Transcript_16259/g.24579 Transcript_16259/m.24579 type:complete len:468 (-) Transcript_16259:2850-4253(-)